ncbi:DNA-binding MarR family transcriptional regulator [Rhodoblastus acidophilus]|nr:DNA-binding MarR family transcriptional regulator [Rhodoblastus acidophilus]
MQASRQSTQGVIEVAEFMAMLRQIGVAFGFNHKFALQGAASRTFGGIAHGAAANATPKRAAFKIKVFSCPALLFSPDLPTPRPTFPSARRSNGLRQTAQRQNAARRVLRLGVKRVLIALDRRDHIYRVAIFIICGSTMTDQAFTLDDRDYAALADFRAALRAFLAFSEARAVEVGLSPQQHQALLAIRGAPGAEATIGYVAERLILKPHSASELISRLEALDLVARRASETDRRKTTLVLTERAADLLGELSAIHREEIRRLKPLLLELLDRFG